MPDRPRQHTDPRARLPPIIIDRTDEAIYDTVSPRRPRTIIIETTVHRGNFQRVRRRSRSPPRVITRPSQRRSQEPPPPPQHTQHPQPRTRHHGMSPRIPNSDFVPLPPPVPKNTGRNDERPVEVGSHAPDIEDRGPDIHKVNSGRSRQNRVHQQVPDVWNREEAVIIDREPEPEPESQNYTIRTHEGGRRHNRRHRDSVSPRDVERVESENKRLSDALMSASQRIAELQNLLAQQTLNNEQEKRRASQLQEELDRCRREHTLASRERDVEIKSRTQLERQRDLSRERHQQEEDRILQEAQRRIQLPSQPRQAPRPIIRSAPPPVVTDLGTNAILQAQRDRRREQGRGK